MANTKHTHQGYYSQIGQFLGTDSVRYRQSLRQIGEKSGGMVFNTMAALLGPVWWGARKLSGLALLFAAVELVAYSHVVTGLFGNLGAVEFEKSAAMAERSAARAQLADIAASEGGQNAEFLRQSAENMAQMAEILELAGREASGRGLLIVGLGVAMLLVAKLTQGWLADRVLAARYAKWRNARADDCRLSTLSLAIVSGLLLAALYLVSQRDFGAPINWLEAFPVREGLRSGTALAIDGMVEALTGGGNWFFDGIRWTISMLLDAIETLFLAPPWPVTGAFILLLTYLSAGARTAIFAGTALAYLGLFGYWDASLRTVALLGTAALIAIAIGLPIGVLCARKPRVYMIVRPVLDFMQTMPAFVYLIPVIALFGIGKPPGVVATLFFGMPPVIRLTALGLQGVSRDAIEAARAFGASEMTILLRVELPLAKRSIMTGINQTILMSLGMVVIASLIGAKGLGQDVLVALQYAATGSGILSGLAILCCAMVLDRVVQGRSVKADERAA